MEERRRSLLNFLKSLTGKPEAYRYVLRQSRAAQIKVRSEWKLIESNGGVEAEPPDFLIELNGKPEAYRYVRRQRRNCWILNRNRLWMGRAEAERPNFLEKANGKPEAYRCAAPKAQLLDLKSEAAPRAAPPKALTKYAAPLEV